MIVDVDVQAVDASFLDDLDDLMEDTMVQMFILQPRSAEALEVAKAYAAEHESIFYAAPQSLFDPSDANCVALRVDGPLLPGDKPLFVDASWLEDDTLRADLAGRRGIILGAVRPYDELTGFFLALEPGNIAQFDAQALNALSMDAIVLGSGYPGHAIASIHTTVKAISDAMFRPEQSISARATKNSLELLGFR